MFYKLLYKLFISFSCVVQTGNNLLAKNPLYPYALYIFASCRLDILLVKKTLSTLFIR